MRVAADASIKLFVSWLLLSLLPSPFCGLVDGSSKGNILENGRADVGYMLWDVSWKGAGEMK